MKVYILFHFVEYDSNDVEGVFATPQLAKDHLTTMVEQDISVVESTWDEDDAYIVSHKAVPGVSTEHTAVYFIEEHELRDYI